MKKWRPLTMKDLPGLTQVVKHINSLGVNELSIRIETDETNGTNRLEILDDTEELYYDGFRFEKNIDELEVALKIDTKDSGAYFDCVCPGRYLADYEGRDRYSLEDAKGELSCAMSKVLYHYMLSNGIKYNWTNELQDRYDKLEQCEEFISFFKDLLKEGK